MIARRLVLALLLTPLLLLAACQGGQNGGDALAFLRDGKLYRLQPNGQGLYEIAPQSAIGFAWSPDHHQLVARFSATPSYPLAHNNLTGAVPDTASVLGVVSIDGGNIITITPANGSPLRSDPWWNANGNRLLYREETPAGQWVQSQADQPVGIARKVVATSPIIPTTAPDGAQIATIIPAGELVIGAPEAKPRVLQSGVLTALPGTTWPARPLWQPHHDAILYPASSSNVAVTLMLTDQAGHAQTVTTTNGLQQYCWSPDGTRILLHTAKGYIIHALAGTPDQSWDDTDADATPFWSPDGRYILIRSETRLDLVTVATGSVRALATFAPPATPFVPQDAWLAAALPITGNPWKADSHTFALVAAGGLWSNGTELSHKTGAGDGLYLITPEQTNPPSLIDWGEHTALSWSTPDPNTQFLTP